MGAPRGASRWRLKGDKNNHLSPEELRNKSTNKIQLSPSALGGLTEVHQGTSQPSSYLPTGYLFGQDHSARLPDGQALGWTSEGSSEDQDQSADMDSGYLGISTDLIPCNNPSRYLPILVTHGTWPVKAP